MKWLLAVVSFAVLVAGAWAQSPTLSESQRQALDREAALGVGLLEEAPRRAWAPSAVSPSEQNQRTAQRLQQKYDDAVARCGGPLPELPSVGMTMQRVFGCTKAGHFPGVDQIVELRLDGRRLQLYVLGRADLGRLYFVDGVLARMEP